MNVRFRERALKDISLIRSYRALQHSEQVADRVEEEIFAATRMLGGHPQFGAETDLADVRRWPMTNYHYTIFYLIDWSATAIDVLRIIDSKRVRDLKKVPR